ncbi:hypothetical protein [Pseudokordiimonas caeni]|uniref:hypothetical protein n=1 Tax=Pseudokordiimonas caeni TaxID=2997908 RepID=UPI0028126B25|nr:hypothetical protein [Pseudokordiimonas caeni]
MGIGLKFMLALGMTLGTSQPSIATDLTDMPIPGYLRRAPEPPIESLSCLLRHRQPDHVRDLSSALPAPQGQLIKNQPPANIPDGLKSALVRAIENDDAQTRATIQDRLLNPEASPPESPTIAYGQSTKLQRAMKGLRALHVLPRGWLLGYDYGEWGGELGYLTNEGNYSRLSNGQFNMQGFRVFEDRIIAYGDLSHLTLADLHYAVLTLVDDEPAVLNMETIREAGLLAILDAPAGGIFLITTRGLYEFDGQKSFKVAWTSDFWPRMATTGYSWKGDRLYVAHNYAISEIPFIRGKPAFEMWLVPQNCKKLVENGAGNCRCE